MKYRRLEKIIKKSEIAYRADKYKRLYVLMSIVLLWVQEEK